MKTLTTCLAFLTVGVGMAFVPSRAAAEIPGTPAAWEGVWTFTTTHRECGETGGEVTVEPDTLCTGEPIFEPDDEDPIAVECTGTATDTSVDVTCTATEEFDPFMFPGCDLTLTYTLVGSRDEDAITATFQRSVTWNGCPPEFEDECIEVLVDASRTGEDPECEPVPVVGASWSQIKTVF